MSARANILAKLRTSLEGTTPLRELSAQLVWSLTQLDDIMGAARRWSNSGRTVPLLPPEEECRITFRAFQTRPQAPPELARSANDPVFYRLDEAGETAAAIGDGAAYARLLRQSFGLALDDAASIWEKAKAPAVSGKLSVEDAITTYLPDYPTQGRKITIDSATLAMLLAMSLTPSP